MRRSLGNAPAGLLAMASALLVGACGGRSSTGDAGTGDAGADCAVATPVDPTFLSASDWSTSGTTILAAGGATFDSAAICARGGVAQTFPSPAFVCGQPLVLSLDTALLDDDRLVLDVGVNGGWNLPAVRLGLQTTTLCLGARALGGTADLFLGIADNLGIICPAPNAGEGPSIELQRAALGPDTMNACPAFGTVTNGDFEDGVTGWALSPQFATAEISTGLGERGSAAAHLATTLLCQNPKLTGTVSLPTDAMVSHPALQVWSNGTRNAVASLKLGPRAPTYLVGAGQPVRTNICIPRWAQGTVQPLALGFLETTMAQDCTITNVRDFAFDSLTFVSEPTCPPEADVFDPGFEQLVLTPTLAPSWALQQDPDDEPSASVALKVDPTFAHAGQVAAVLSVSSACPGASLSATVTVPAPAPDAGPMLSFWYKTSAVAHAGLAVTLSALAAPLSLIAEGDWTQVRACLAARLAGRPDLLTFSITGGGGECSTTYPAETLAIDDVALTTDARCAVIR